MKHESMTVLQRENTNRRQVSRKLPMTMSLSQSRRAVKENRRPTKDDRSDGRASGVAGTVPLRGTEGFKLGGLLMLVNPRSCCTNESSLERMMRKVEGKVLQQD